MLRLRARLHLHACVCLFVHLCLAPPPEHQGSMRLWWDGKCGECKGWQCPPAPTNCPAGLVPDSCGCCLQCGNVEGQLCDPDRAQDVYGRCGEGLHCQRGRDVGDSEPKCICQASGSVCGSDGRTYPNLCQLREAASQADIILQLAGQGPCYTAPRISRAPRDLTNYTGNDIIFSCEVTAFPWPHLSWRKKGTNDYLPGDDPHISVQARGGPQKHTVSTWLHIQGLRPTDAGVYFCVSRNALGATSASARLTVLRQVVRVQSGYPEEDYYYDDTEETEDDNELESGDYQG